MTARPARRAPRPAAAPAAEELTQAADAERFAARHRFDLRYVHGWDEWCRWEPLGDSITGGRWAPDRRRTVRELAKESLRALIEDAAGRPEDEYRRVLRHVEQGLRAPYLESLLFLASSDPLLAVHVEDLDRQPMLLNVLNGTVNLETGAIAPAAREDLITKLAPVAYDPAATCPTWDAFLARVTGKNDQLAAFIRRAVGYSLTGDVSEHALFMAHGTGANGKSTLMETVLAILGDYAKPAAPGLLMRTRDNRNEEEIAELQGVRFATGQENAVDQAFDEPRLKRLTGGDTVSARHLYAKRFRFAPTHKIWIGTNHKPRVRGGDDGIWRRLRLIPFDQVIAEHERDPKLREKLLAEAPGILAWAVRGCREWQRDGLGVPAEVRDATNSYRAAEDQVGPFLEECCTLALAARVPGSKLHQAYRAWAEAAGERPMSQQALAEALEARGFERKRTQGARMWVGLALRAGAGDGVTGQGSVSDTFSHTRAREEVS